MGNKLPEYVRAPIQGFLDYADESMRLLHMSMQGISKFTMHPEIVKALEETDHAVYTPEEIASEKREGSMALKPCSQVSISPAASTLRLRK